MRTSTRSRRRSVVLLAAGCATVTAIAGCSGGGSGSSSGKVVTGGTFTMAMISDPGSLDPQMNTSSALFQMSVLAYDSLLGQDSKGRIVPQLASKWQVSGKTTTLTMKPGITCSDGSAFTAATAAQNINFIGNPKNKSPFAGVFVPAGASATATKNTVTVKVPTPAPFILNDLAAMPMVCSKGLANRKSLAAHTDGTGPYVLDKVEPNSRYTLSKRAGYTWGPAGARTSTAGMPDKIDVQIITNMSTQANLLLSGQLNAGTITGPDLKRVQAAKMYSATTPAVVGQQWYNQSSKRLTADPKLREALSLAVDFTQLRRVLTSDQGSAPTTFAATSPSVCPGNSIGPVLPQRDLAKAKSVLDADGWTMGADGYRHKGGKPLDLTFVYNTDSGAPGAAAAQLASTQWKQLGVKAKLTPQDHSTVLNTMFATGNWDIGWEGLNVSAPDQLMGFLSGPASPAGSNFASLHNAGYNSATAKAETLQGKASCPQWLAAESSLVKDYDVIPFANLNAYTFGKGAKFQMVGGDVMPTTIRMVG
jgi:peptide/nickel transport system substrate-binding protein